jgi:tetratricopeptide (TPR) repeat protein
MNEDLAGALSDADEALRFSPNDDQAYQTRGQIKLATGDYEGALADLSASIEQSGASATSLTYSGLAHAGAGSIWKARADFELALSSPRKGYVFEVAAALAIAKQKLQQIDDRFDARWKRTVKRINDWYFELVGPAFSLNFNVKSSSDQSSASDAVIVFDSPTPVGLCIFPVPRVTQKLLARAAERPEEADAIESNIEALAAQYCRMHHQVPKSDYDEDIGSSCTMHTGVLNNERVYWASCSGN